MRDGNPVSATRSTISRHLGRGALGSIDKTGQDAKSYGVSLQAAEKSKLFGLGNHFVVGASYDHGQVAYQASSELGYFLPKYVVAGAG